MKEQPKRKARPTHRASTPLELSKLETTAPGGGATTGGQSDGGLYERVRAILEDARHRVARSVNTEMVHAYWMIGQAIVEHEQQGKERAEYGAQLIESLAERLKADKLKGFQARNLWWMRDFYLKFPALLA